MSTPKPEGFSHKVDAKARGLKQLTQEQVDFFLEHGYIALRGLIPQETIERFKGLVWVRLGMDEHDKSTWTKEEIHMPAHRMEPIKVAAPKVYDAICDLVGGEERLEPKSAAWRDGFICNLGDPAYDPNEVIDPRDLGPWHNDGDWFRHFLDSECQALETLILFSDVEERAGPTYICPDGTIKVAEWLRDHPEGSADMCWPEGSGNRVVPGMVRESKEFVTLTGKTGDVFLCHPLTPHSRSRNHIRNSRFIINPHITINEPFDFNRANPDDYSIVELTTLKMLKTNSLDFRPTRERKRWIPRTMNRKHALIEEELARLKAHAEKTGVPVHSMHLNGVHYWQVEMMDLPEEEKEKALNAPHGVVPGADKIVPTLMV